MIWWFDVGLSFVTPRECVSRQIPEQILLLFSLYFALHFVLLPLKHFHEMVRNKMNAAYRGAHRASLVGGKTRWLCFFWWWMLCLQRHKQSLGFKYTISFVKKVRLLCMMAKEYSQGFAPLWISSAPLNLPFHERTSALSVQLLTIPVHGKSYNRHGSK